MAVSQNHNVRMLSTLKFIIANCAATIEQYDELLRGNSVENDMTYKELMIQNGMLLSAYNQIYDQIMIARARIECLETYDDDFM